MPQGPGEPKNHPPHAPINLGTLFISHAHLIRLATAELVHNKVFVFFNKGQTIRTISRNTSHCYIHSTPAINVRLPVHQSTKPCLSWRTHGYSSLFILVLFLVTFQFHLIPILSDTPRISDQGDSSWFGNPCTERPRSSPTITGIPH